MAKMCIRDRTNTTATLKLPNGDIHTLVGGSYHFEIDV